MSSATFTGLEGYSDAVMGSVAFGELFCVLAAIEPPTTPEAWRKALGKYGHSRDAEAAYAHAIAAGLLIPKGRELHMSAEFVQHASQHADFFKAAKTA